MDDPNKTTVNPTPPPDPTTSPTPPPGPTLGWAAPASGASWRDQRRQERRDRRDRGDGRFASLFVGLVVLGIGLWFFAEHTLNLAMPVIRWSQLWPVFLIVLGALVLLRSIRRGPG